MTTHRSGRVAYVGATLGLAGDMLLGALIDAGADPDRVAATIGGLGLDGYALTFERVSRSGVAATRAVVVVHGTHDDDTHGHRPVARIIDLLDAADLPEPVRRAAAAVFRALATAEGAVHGVAPGDVELHEVGALDSIVDVVGVCTALHDLGVEHLVGSPVALGHGTVRTAHGEVPNPPPAVARMLAARGIPTVGIDTTMELSTPTGVALLAALAESFGPPPPMTVTAAGFGAGTADPPGRANVVQVLLGTVTAARVPGPGQAAVELAVNVDDVTGEVLAHTIVALMAAGAHDAWATPIVMKKGRPAHTVSALAGPADADHLAAVLLAETGSLGVRATTVTRWPQPREESTVDVDGHAVRIKRAAGRTKVEHDDAVAAATALGLPLREVLRRAETLAPPDGTAT